MDKEVDWAREFDELDGAVEADKIEIDWLEEFDKMIEEVESLPGYPGVAEFEPKVEVSQTVIEGEIVEAVEEEKLSKGKGEWLKGLLNREVSSSAVSRVILGLILGGGLLIAKGDSIPEATTMPGVEPVVAVTAEPTLTPAPAETAVDTEIVESVDSGEIIDWARDKLNDFAESYGLDSKALLAGVGENDYDWSESETLESAGGTGVEIEAEVEPLANKVDLVPGQAEYVLKSGDTMLSVAEEMKNDKLVSNQVEGLARLFKNNSWFSEGANFDRYRDYIPEIKTMLEAKPGANPADITMGDGRTLAEWLIQVMHDVPAGLEIKI